MQLYMCVWGSMLENIFVNFFYSGVDTVTAVVYINGVGMSKGSLKTRKVKRTSSIHLGTKTYKKQSIKGTKMLRFTFAVMVFLTAAIHHATAAPLDFTTAKNIPAGDRIEILEDRIMTDIDGFITGVVYTLKHKGITGKAWMPVRGGASYSSTITPAMRIFIEEMYYGHNGR